MVYLITGKAGAGKTVYAKRLVSELINENIDAVNIDGDELRAKTKNKSYDDIGREKNLIEAAEMARDYEEKGYTVVCSFIAPKKKWRDMMRKLWKESLLVYIPGGTLWEGTEYEKPTKGELSWQ